MVEVILGKMARFGKTLIFWDSLIPENTFNFKIWINLKTKLLSSPGVQKE